MTKPETQYVMVPREPTDAMLLALYGDGVTAPERYQRLLASAPVAPEMGEAAEEMQACENCRKEFPLSTMSTSPDDCWLCQECIKVLAEDESPTPTPPESVREWLKWRADHPEEVCLTAMAGFADRMAAELTQLWAKVEVYDRALAELKDRAVKATARATAAESTLAEQAKTIEGLRESNEMRLAVAESAMERADKNERAIKTVQDASRAIEASLEATVSELRGELGGARLENARLTQSVLHELGVAEDALNRAQAAEARCEAMLNGARELPLSREQLGRFVREAWVRWAESHPAPKPSWLVSYDGLSESDKEADRQIGEAIARWTLVFDAQRFALTPATDATPDKEQTDHA